MSDTVPERFDPQFLEDLDGRTLAAKRLRNRLAEVHADLGGVDVLSYSKRSLALRAIWLESWLEAREVEAAQGKPIDIGRQTQALNTLIGLWRLLGLERRPRDVPSLNEYLGRQASA